MPTIADFVASGEADPTYRMLGQLLGDVPGMLEGTDSPLSVMFTTFNMACFVVAMLMILYGVISGIMHTAVEGQFLGRRHSSIWYPIRVVYGIFGLVPMFGGYSFPQVLMIFGMVVGVGVANVTWTAGWQAMLGSVESLVLLNPEAAAASDDTLQTLVLAQVCSITHNIQEEQAAAESGKVKILYNENGDLTQQGTVTKLLFGSAAAEAGHQPDACGGVTIWPQSMEAGPLEGPEGPAAREPFGYQDVAAAQARALVRLAQNLHPISLALATRGIRPSPAALALIKNEYKQDVAESLADVAQDAQRGLGRWLEYDGSSWLYAGAIFLKIASVNRDIANAAGAEIKPIEPGRSGIFAQMWDRATGIVEGWVDTAQAILTVDFPQIFGDSMESAGMAAALRGLISGESDLLIGLVALGHTLSVAGAAGLAFSAGAAGTPGIGEAIQALGLPTLFQIIILLGVILAFFLPFVPFILWFSGVISYFIVCMEAICGAPVWMLAHLETEGEGLGQKTAHGYLFLLNVLFRPVLMVIGLVGGWWLMKILGKFLQYSLSVIYGSSSFAFSGWASIGSFLATLIIFCYLSYVLISRCFSLIHHLPNEVLAWAGGGAAGKVGGQGDEDRQVMAVLKGEGARIQPGGGSTRPGGKSNTISPPGPGGVKGGGNKIGSAGK